MTRAWRGGEPGLAVVRSVAEPLWPTGGLTVLTGSLAPRGAIIKDKAADRRLLRYGGPAVVFTSLQDLERRIDDPDLPVTPDSVLVLQGAGPVGAPGMPEAGSFPVPGTLLARGVRDIVRISDARMSGTASGTVVLHAHRKAPLVVRLPLCATATSSGWMLRIKRLDLLVPGRSTGRAAPESGDIHAGLAGSGRRLSRTISCARSAS